MLQWAGAFIGAAKALHQHSTEVASLQSVVDSFMEFTPKFRVVMLMLWAAAGNATQLFDQCIQIFGFWLPIVQFVILLFNWMHVFVLYRERLLSMRRGAYFYNRGAFGETLSSRYVGYQVAGMTVSTIIFGNIGVVIALTAVAAVAIIMTYATVINWLFDSLYTLGPTLYSTVSIIVLSILLQTVLNKLVFFEGPIGHQWLTRFRFFYAVFDYNMIFFNTLLGLGVIIVRFIVWFFLGVLMLGRIDLTLMPGGGVWQVLDFSYAPYVAMIAQDHRYNNPVNVVFFELMLNRLRTCRLASARRKLARFVSSSIGDSSHLAVETTPTAIRMEATKSPSLMAHVNRRARNRWQLARILLSTPALRQWRREARSNAPPEPADTIVAEVSASAKEARAETYAQRHSKRPARANVILM